MEAAVASSTRTAAGDQDLHGILIDEDNTMPAASPAAYHTLHTSDYASKLGGVPWSRASSPGPIEVYIGDENEYDIEENYMFIEKCNPQPNVSRRWGKRLPHTPKKRNASPKRWGNETVKIENRVSQPEEEADPVYDKQNTVVDALGSMTGPDANTLSSATGENKADCSKTDAFATTGKFANALSPAFEKLEAHRR